MCIYNANDDKDISKVSETQDVYHLICCHFNYMIINHLEYWNAYSLLITSFPNNVNKIQKHSFNLQLFTEYPFKKKIKHFGDTRVLLNRRN